MEYFLSLRDGFAVCKMGVMMMLISWVAMKIK